MMRIGLDVGSTTVKIVATDNSSGETVYSSYGRHNAKARETVAERLGELMAQRGDDDVTISVTGSVGMGISEACGLPFVQEVVAATDAIGHLYPGTRSMIDIGGEDAKVVFFRDGEATDLRMNGNCAGGTGAFIDQMAVILGTTPDKLGRLALSSERIYPIASRCGVFCKTDIQNLVARNVSREDIAASIFHAVAVQTVTTLAHGFDITPPVLFCGGPMTFIPALRQAFMDYLNIDDTKVVVPGQGTLLPAIGAAMHRTDGPSMRLSALRDKIERGGTVATDGKGRMAPLFADKTEHRRWLKRMASRDIHTAELKKGRQELFIGIDSGSTTTKVVALNTAKELVFSYYHNNNGNPIKAVSDGLSLLRDECRRAGTEPVITGSCSTGYGEDLIKAAFRMHSGIIETIAHSVAARWLDPDVSFILDIGGQDMKAIFIDHGIISRIEINEACSSGCGSFIETFARGLGYTTGDFAAAACRAAAPCDLGTRCTVFMNSKVKQVLREGATVEDIAAGLAVSVARNCLHKVLKLKDTSELGHNIVVQGGTMRNDAVVRALEVLTGAEVTRCDRPELMGAMGCALYAAGHRGRSITLDDMIDKARYTTTTHNCKGCDNRCPVVCYRFDNGQNYWSGNRCERVFSNGRQRNADTPENIYARKNRLLFERESIRPEEARMTIGIPRSLNMYEEYPFWYTLFTRCGLRVVLSEQSRFAAYEQCARMVMSDNICFPAKLVHSHIGSLVSQGVDRIFMPFVVYERQDAGQNSFNCPIVTGYSEVVKSVQAGQTPIDSPAITLRDDKLLLRECTEYLGKLGIDTATVKDAFRAAQEEQDRFTATIERWNDEALSRARAEGRLTIMLAGRPYHADPLVQHKVAEMMSAMGVGLITDDIVRNKAVDGGETNLVAQWSYPNRILRAARWCAAQGDDVQFVEMTSFGCGPDAFLTDEIRDLLMRYGKTLTLLKLDDINNTGSMKLRVRSLVESMKMAGDANAERAAMAFRTTPVYDKTYRHRKLLVPYFTPMLSPLIPSIMRVAGYEVVSLPPSDEESCDWGLRMANNEVCYPATLIVGDIIKAFKSGQQNPAECAVAMTQTGGQCRASNYVALIKKALTDAGYSDVPVVSLTFGGTIENDQPAFKMNWMKILPVALRAILYSDCIGKFYYAAVARELAPGLAARLRDKYLTEAARLIEQRQSKRLYALLGEAADEFNGICADRDCPRVGIVGEIYLKFNPFAQRNVTQWLIDRGIEVVPPVIADFFMQSFVNRRINIDTHVERSGVPDFVVNTAYKMISRQFRRVNATASRFRYFTPLSDIFSEAREAERVVTLNAQFGEGWLLPAEIMSYAGQGVQGVVSLQPFGCIANHIVSKGIEKRIRQLWPDLNLLSLDFDSGVSDVNITNRLLLFIDKIKKYEYSQECQR